ncbi:MAG: hypothetical protein ACI9JM_002635 [Halioglobus sp.]|jgi:hypothetical protein
MIMTKQSKQGNTMKITSRFFLLAMAGLLTNPAAAGTNTITVSWSPLSGAGIPTLGTYGTIALAMLLAIVAFRVIKARPVAAKYLVVAALSLTVLATAVLIPQVIASAPVIIPLSSGCEAGSATYPDTDDSVSFINECDVVMQIQLNFDNARCNESQAVFPFSGDQIEPTGEEVPKRLPYCVLVL